MLVPNVATSLGGVGTATPLMDGIAAAGTSAAAAHEDHVHPTDTSRAAIDQTFYFGTTALAINRTSSGLAVAGVQVNVRTQSLASSASITPSPDTDDLVAISALAADTTFNNPTPVVNLQDGQRLLIRILDNGVSRGITWDSQYRSMGAILPTATVAGKTSYLGFFRNNSPNKWDLLSLVTQA